MYKTKTDFLVGIDVQSRFLPLKHGPEAAKYFHQVGYSSVWGMGRIQEGENKHKDSVQEAYRRVIASIQSFNNFQAKK